MTRPASTAACAELPAPERALPDIDLGKSTCMNVATTRVVLPRLQGRRQALRAAVLVARSRSSPSTAPRTARANSIPGINGTTRTCRHPQRRHNLKDDSRCAEARAWTTTPMFSSPPITASRPFAQRDQPGGARCRPRRAGSDSPSGFLAIDIAQCARRPAALRSRAAQSDPSISATAQRPAAATASDRHRAPTIPMSSWCANGGTELRLSARTDRDKTAPPDIVDNAAEAGLCRRLFVNDELWARRFAGTLPMSAINLIGAAQHAAARYRGQFPLLRGRAAQLCPACAQPRSPTPRYRPARACTAPSAAPTRATSWRPSGRTSKPVRRHCARLQRRHRAHAGPYPGLRNAGPRAR